MMSGESSRKMQRREGFNMFVKGLICIAVVPLLATVCMGGELSESQSLLSFIRSVDPQRKLGAYQWNEFSTSPCLVKSEVVKCNLQGTSIIEIRLESLNLSGVINADALCKLQSLEVLSLARNQIHGTIPRSISYCKRLRYLNLSSNSLSGRVSWSTLTKLKYLKSLDISNNHFTNQEFEHVYKYSQLNATVQNEIVAGTPGESNNNKSNTLLWTLVPLFLGLGFFFMFLYCMGKILGKRRKANEIPMAIKESPLKHVPVNAIQELKPEGRHQELVFFVEDHERFKLDDLLDASANLRSQSLYTSLYKVILKNNATYAVKRLKKLQVSFKEFEQTMRRIGNLKHRNVLPLVGYSCADTEKLLFYKYQSNGSLLSLLQGYIEGKKEFPWRFRLTIATGIARGLAFIYQSSNDQDSIPHGNLKLSNILLGENMEPLISEYGISRLLDPKKNCLVSSNGYMAPEKSLSEQGDVFSFGIILLELLTGKTVEKTGVDLPKWVGSMVREEWTGEVFGKDVTKDSMQWAFPLLNIALKCVSHSPKDRPTTAEVLQKIDEALFAHEDRTVSSMSSWESGPRDCCMLHSVIPETWDTPGSNY
ncbi:hypothetical protein ES288_D01G098400v1 [Gossypium darwinii]|uniref:Probably inactive receptor-like protein kinase At5g41680 n=3 Tax=Gossypium TaxID=3633 RepID=A0A1U8KXL3_GOSHI|nr:probably inactive receptor-like protein kinase At5g41680 [Gossypium hirsutum]TYG82557.1 hypothetical protein ES288_D01G098400v1 [Gossypium darwinii]